MKRSAECKPGYGCLKCKLPPFECDYSEQKIFPRRKADVGGGAASADSAGEKIATKKTLAVSNLLRSEGR